MNILGINAYHGDAAACVVIDGRLVAAIEEERFERIKHWTGFPAQAIRWCLEAAGLRSSDLDHVAVGRNPSAHLLRKAAFALSRRPSLALVKDRVTNRSRVLAIGERVCAAAGVSPESLRARLHFVEHHCAHLASSFFVSPFEQAVCVSIDGFGDFVSTMIARGQGSRIRVKRLITFPHSLGAFYTAGTQYLGFGSYGDEYKVMGLAAYGEPAYMGALRRIVRDESHGLFSLDTRWFRHPREIVDTKWEEGSPELGNYYADPWVKEFGPPRAANDEIEPRHRDLARSLQLRLEEVYRRLIGEALKDSDATALCLAGGCAYNSVANGVLLREMPSLRLYVPPAAGDAGTAIGAAFWVWHQVLRMPRAFHLEHASLGPEYTGAQIRQAIESRGLEYRQLPREEERVAAAAARLEAGEIVGWFQGREEWGPRALGHRSILADPRRGEMREALNSRIKKRESFRPLAPSILAERTADFFETSHPSPFMTQTYRVKPDVRHLIPAVTHVDGSSRPQTVTREVNPLFERLLRAFGRRTGIPVLLNTSFNENEPIVHTPEEAVACFQRTRMDALVIGDALVSRNGAE